MVIVAVLIILYSVTTSLVVTPLLLLSPVGVCEGGRQLPGNEYYSDIESLVAQRDPIHGGGGVKERERVRRSLIECHVVIVYGLCDAMCYMIFQ